MSANQKGLFIVYTGHGKGKTTAALGIALRCWGRGMQVSMLQFIKKKELKSGEHLAARSMDGIEIIPLGDGFTWLSKDLEIDKQLARDAWRICVAKIESGTYDVVILDELTYCINFKWLEVDEVLDVIAKRKPGMHVVVTGRDAPEKMIEVADLVTEMTMIKHPFESGVKPQKGIDL